MKKPRKKGHHLRVVGSSGEPPDPRAPVTDPIARTVMHLFSVLRRAMPEESQIKVLGDVVAERQRRDAQHGDVQTTIGMPDGTGMFAAIEMAEALKRDCDTARKFGVLTWRHVLHEEIAEAAAELDPVKLRAELIQVASVAIEWAEAIDLRSRAPTPEPTKRACATFRGGREDDRCASCGVAFMEHEADAPVRP